jgi:glycosyltransferase involved in cell wall biosynthesis
VLFGPLAVVRRETLTPTGLPRLLAAARRTQPALRRLIAERGIDIVQANTSVILGLRGPAPRLVVHVHEIYPPVPVAWPVFRRHLLRADALVCASEATRAALGAGQVIYAGVAFDARRADRAASRAAFDLPEDAFVAAVLGRISAWKGQEVLVEALPDDAIGLIAGDAWPGQEHRADALRRPNTRLVGFRDDVEHVYGAADVVVVPSTAPDPLPNAALEALAAGCCVVAADHGGLPEMIRDGETGVLVPPGDASALRAALAALRADPDRRARLGAAAAEDVRARFPRENPARRFEELYAQLLRPRR